MAVTAQDVLDLMDSAKTTTEVAPHLNTAQVLTGGTMFDGCGYSADELDEITLWLAAHLVACSIDPSIRTKVFGDARTTYHGQAGLGLDHTPYGQQLQFIDRCGRLEEAANSKRPAEVKVIGM